MRNLFLIVIFLFANVSFAQTYVIQNIIELSNDLGARVNPINDTNGNGCAIVRINIPSAKKISFDSSIIGTPNILPGEYNVYVPKNTSSISFTMDGQTYNIDFSSYDIAIEEKKCYRVVFSKAQSDNSKKCNIKIVANYDNAVVMIDGVPVGQVPLTLDNISLGEHVISVPNTFGVTLNDTIVEITENSTITLSLYNEKRKPVIVDMATPGGDSAEWYRIFGTNVKEENGKKGIVDYAGNIIVPCEYDYIYPSIQNGYYVVEKNGEKGLYEPGKGQVVPCTYDIIYTRESYSHDSYMPIKKNGKWGVMSPVGQVIVPIEYEHSHCYEGAISVKYEEAGYEAVSGLYSYDGEIIISPRYPYLNAFVNGYAFFEKFDKSIGFVDKNGNETIIPANYSIGRNWGEYSGATLMNGVFRVKDKVSDKWGYMDTNLNLIIPTIYDAMEDYDDAPNFNQGIAPLKLNGSKVIVNSKGNIILDCNNSPYNDFIIVSQGNYRGDFYKYDYSDGEHSNTLILVKNEENLCGLLDVDGNIVVPCQYEENNIQWFTQDGKNYFVLTEQEQVLVKDQKQNLLFSLPSNLVVSEITDGFIMVRDQETNSYGYLNMKGEILANCIYGYDSDENKIDESQEGYDITGIIDEQPISEGLAILNIGDRFGFIDNKGEIKVPLIYTAVTPFENGISYVRQVNGEWKKIYKKDL